MANRPTPRAARAEPMCMVTINHTVGLLLTTQKATQLVNLLQESRVVHHNHIIGTTYLVKDCGPHVELETVRSKDIKPAECVSQEGDL